MPWTSELAQLPTPAMASRILLMFSLSSRSGTTARGRRVLRRPRVGLGMGDLGGGVGVGLGGDTDGGVALVADETVEPREVGFHRRGVALEQRTQVGVHAAIAGAGARGAGAGPLVDPA